MNFISEVYWNKGGRMKNQDAISVQEVVVKGKRVIFALVCDGIGGLQAGEEASGFVAERMTEWFYKETLPMLKRCKGKNKILKAGVRALYICNEEMMDFGKKNRIKLGTTLTMIIIYNSTYLLWHSGDTRAYLIHSSSKPIRQLTKDHVKDTHMITRCIGSYKWQKPDTCKGRIWGRNTVLICSDGFRHIVDGKQLGEMLMPEQMTSQERIYKRLKEIAEYSIKRGESDNISAVAIRTG